MPLVHITRRERFSAAHKLSRPDWSPEKNYSTFGKCSNPNWHGHNYELWVTVKGSPDPETSFVTDLSLLSTIIEEHVVDHLVEHIPRGGAHGAIVEIGLALFERELLPDQFPVLLPF